MLLNFKTFRVEGTMLTVPKEATLRNTVSEINIESLQVAKCTRPPQRNMIENQFDPGVQEFKLCLVILQFVVTCC